MYCSEMRVAQADCAWSSKLDGRGTRRGTPHRAVSSADESRVPVPSMNAVNTIVTADTRAASETRLGMETRRSLCFIGL